MSAKYPRTFHLPWSAGLNSEERVIGSTDGLLNTPLVLTEKMDGSNVCLEHASIYARSHNDAPRHESFHALKALHAAARHSIPVHWQIFGEWLWARHSIAYERLPAYLLLFGVRDQSSHIWLAWDEQERWAAAQGFALVPVLWRGVCHTEEELKEKVQAHTNAPTCSQEQEGVVVRVSAATPDEAFARCVAKWVRPHHVQTDKGWREQQITRNRLLP